VNPEIRIYVGGQLRCSWPVDEDTPRAKIAEAVTSTGNLYAALSGSKGGAATAYVVVGNVYHWLGRWT